MTCINCRRRSPTRDEQFCEECIQELKHWDEVGMSSDLPSSLGREESGYYSDEDFQEVREFV